MVSRSGERVQPVETRNGESYKGGRVCRTFYEDEHERPPILHEMRGASHDQPPTFGLDRRVCGDNTEPEIQPGSPCQLRRDSAADERRPAEAEGLSGRNGRVRRRLVRVTGFDTRCATAQVRPKRGICRRMPPEARWDGRPASLSGISLPVVCS